MTLCLRCAKTPVPENFMSERRCAFTHRYFDTDNWQCETMLQLREQAEPYRVYAEDCSAAVIPLPAIFGGGLPDFMLLSWYKNRGRTDSCRIYDKGNRWRAPTAHEAETILSALESEP